MKITLLENVGFCHGVEESLTILEKNYQPDKALYLLGMLVHNEIVNNELKKIGIKIINESELQNLDKNPYDKIIFTTAHGTDPKIIQFIKKRGYQLIDTTCPIVRKNNELINHYYQDGFEIIYIGIKNHPESTAVKKYVHIVENKNDIDNLNIINNRIVVISQTTMTKDNIDYLYQLIIKKYPNALNNTSICPFVKKRQDELNDFVSKNHSPLDYYLVLGGKMSNNTLKLVEIIKKYTNSVSLLSSFNEIYELNLKDRYNVYITSGASTPMKFIREVKDFLEKNSK